MGRGYGPPGTHDLTSEARQRITDGVAYVLLGHLLIDDCAPEVAERTALEAILPQRVGPTFKARPLPMDNLAQGFGLLGQALIEQSRRPAMS
jgi:hypothetical protein